MMTINDIIVLLTLIIALIAIINEKNRAHLLLKLTVGDIIIFMISFILINYFVFYQDFYQRDLVVHSLYFYGFGLHEPKHYAYFFTLLSLIYLFYKIYGSFYANSKIDKVEAFYTKQIENQEITFLLDLLEKYHKKDIIKLIVRSQDETKRTNQDVILEGYESETRGEKIKNWWNSMVASIFPRSWANRSAFASRVLFYIIDTPGFVCHAANLRPYFFADIYRNFSAANRQHFPDDLINSFFTELLYQKNYWLKKELKESENFDGGQPTRFHESNKILSSLLTDLSVSAQNNVWQSFGNIAVDEIQYERLKGIDSHLYREYISESQLWEFKTQYTIQFLKILVTEAISKLFTGEHFWLYYYDRIIGQMLKSWAKEPPEDEVKKTVGYKFIDNIFDIILRWLDLSNEKVDTALYHDIIRCAGNIIQQVTESEEFPEDEKIEMIERLIGTYCRLKENGQTDTFRTQLEVMLTCPNMLIEEGSAYYALLDFAWRKFDKVPHRNHAGDFDYLTRLKNNLITPLGIDPNVN